MHLSLAPFYRGWGNHQQHLIQALTLLTSEHLAYSAIPGWPVGRIAAHIIAARVWWFHVRMGEGNAELAPLEHWDGAGQPARRAEELVNGLERTWQMVESALARWTPADLEHVFPARSDDPIARTRQWIIWHVLEHDLFHSGELSCILGAHGLAGVALE
jgi:uncharacterized damage-inducible protein DinB